MSRCVAMFRRQQKITGWHGESETNPLGTGPVVPADCEPMIVAGLWPAELQSVNAQTAPVAQRLSDEFRRVVEDTNRRLRFIEGSTENAYVKIGQVRALIDNARDYAMCLAATAVDDIDKSAAANPSADTGAAVGRDQHIPPDAPADNSEEPRSGPRPSVVSAFDPPREPRQPATQSRGAAGDDATVVSRVGSSTSAAPQRSGSPRQPDAVAERWARGVERGPADGDGSPAAAVTNEAQSLAPPRASATHELLLGQLPSLGGALAPAASSAVRPRAGGPADLPPVLRQVGADLPAAVSETADAHLARLVDHVARQEPGLRWGAGYRTDGTILLVTDLAHGWIPPGMDLADEIELLAPGRHDGGIAELLNGTVLSSSYAPGDLFTNGYSPMRITCSTRPLQAPPVQDLAWKLSEATQGRDGLPHLVADMAKAAMQGTQVKGDEINLVRVHLDTARYQVMAQYPDVDAVLLTDCMLLAATEALLTGNRQVANYHFAWFEAATPSSSSHR